MGWVTKFFDDFDDASVGVQTDLGNGTVTEPAGSELILSCVAGTHCNWDDDEHDAPVAYEEFASHLASITGLLRIECRLSSHVRSTTYCIPGLVVYSDRDNMYWLGWYDYNDDMYVQRLASNVFTTQYQAGNYGDPNTTPHIYRIYWNRLPRRVWVQDADRYLEPGEMGFQFSSNDGTSWVWALTQTPPFAPTRFGVFFRNFTDWPSVQSGFDYLKLEEDTDPNIIIGDQEPEKENRPQPSGRVEVEVSPRSLGGYEGYLFGRGVELQGPDAQVDIEASPRDLGGAQASSVDPSRGELVSTPGNVAEVHIGVLGDVIDADYLVEKDDADGNELLNDLEVVGILLADPSAGSFGTPVGNNHYGAARDGKFYWDGVECTPGDFGTVAGGPRRTAWPHWRGATEPFADLHAAGTSHSIPSDDVVRLQGTNMNDFNGPRIWSRYGWRLVGDFDIQVDYFDFSHSGGSDGGFSLFGRTDGRNQIYIRRQIGNIYDRNVMVNGSWVSWQNVATTDTAGKLRLVRSGTSVSMYYWDGVSSWVQVGTPYDMGKADTMWVGFQLNGQSNLTADIKISNFTINSGTATNRAIWYDEASGDHRGTQQSVPDKLLVVTTKSTLELLDATNEKLWMRFLQGTNNVMGATATGTRVRRAAWDNGLLFVAYGDETGAGGAAIWIDFTMDSIRWHRTDAASDTGGYYRATTSARDGGALAARNGAETYGGDYSEWQIPSYKVDDVDLYRDSGDEFRAIATYAGMAMFKIPRWYIGVSGEYSLSIETGHMRWCHLDQSDGELFYMDDSTMYSRNKSGLGQGWEDWMTGGTWTAEYSKALPGTRRFDFQKHAVKIGSYLYLPAEEGVYRVSWPSGSWELFYGKTMSGATHEIFPDYERVTCLAKANDGSEDILVVGLERAQRGQVVAVKLSDNSVYGKLEIVDLKVPSVVAS